VPVGTDAGASSGFGGLLPSSDIVTEGLDQSLGGTSTREKGLAVLDSDCESAGPGVLGDELVVGLGSNYRASPAERSVKTG
jgi:hypothetical protein